MAWNRPSEGAAKPAPKKPSAMRGVVAGLVVVAVALGAVCYFMIGGSQETPRHKADKERGRIKQVKTAVASREKASDSAKEDARRDAWPGQTDKDAPIAGKAATSPTDSSNQQMTVVEERQPPSPGNLPTASDQVLAMLSDSGGGGIEGPPPPNHAMSDKEFRESLKKEIVILETDDERTVKMKEEVIGLRQQMLELLDQGMTVDEILTEHRENAEKDAELKRKATLDLIELVDSGNYEQARKYRLVVNAALQQMGIKDVSYPVSPKEFEELAAERDEKAMQEAADAGK